MPGEYVKVAEFVRGVVDGKVVVRRPGARIPVELALKLGVIEAPPVAPKPARPIGATPPRRRPPRKSTTRKKGR